ncbi:hypothetical protein BY458DRAFT_543764 [Sporodiniella umbellata]|nr:hypothetical protein BY458DRAFT_543764 [Sporodiniella umbellata]
MRRYRSVSHKPTLGSLLSYLFFARVLTNVFGTILECLLPKPDLYHTKEIQYLRTVLCNFHTLCGGTNTEKHFVRFAVFFLKKKIKIKILIIYSVPGIVIQQMKTNVRLCILSNY